MLTVALLGQLNVRLDDRAVDLRLRPVQLLLAYLLLNRDKTHRREQLAGILWPDYTETSARKNLRNTVYRLRQAVGEEYVAAERSTITFNAVAAYWLDVAQLEESTAAEEVEDLIQAVGLYQGELLPGFYEDWILWERERLQAVFERQMQALLARLNDAGRWLESLTWAEHWIAQGRVPEPAYRALMQAHAGLGDQASMAQAYRRGRQALEETMGVPPAAETERLYRELLAGDEREIITTAEPVTAATEEVIGAMPRARLPRPVTPFIGRQRELVELHRWLEDEASGRLVTIVGPGGMGKTRLALAAARARQRAGQTTAFISLTELDEPENLATAIAEALGLQLTAGADPIVQLLAYLRNKRLLLVLDNFEHLLDGVNLVAQMRGAAPGLALLVTSRERLRLPGEQLLPLQGLRYPGDQRELSDRTVASNMAQYAAVQFFLDNARRQIPEFTPADDDDLLALCQITGGMPLALELAAAWVDSLTLPDLVRELKHNLDLLTQKQTSQPDRHHSIRAVFDTTWQFLNENEREAFARLAIFRGGFTRPAAESVAEVRLPILTALVGRHLVQLDHGRGRYTLHELMRQYGLEQLAALAELDLIRQRHYAYYLQLAKTADVHLRGPEQGHWLDRLDSEQDNFRAALTWSVTQSIIDAANLALTLSWYWRIRNQVIEARQWLAEVLSRGTAETAVNAALHFQAGHMAWMQGDYPTARQHQETSQAMWQSLAEAGINGLAYARHALGMIAHQEEKFAEAYHHLAASLLLFKKSQDQWGVAFAQQWLGATLMQQGDLAMARGLLEESLVSVRDIGDRWATGLVLAWLAWLELAGGNWDQAFDLADEARPIAEVLGHWHSLGAILDILAQVARKKGDLAAARQYYEESFKLYTEMGNEHLAAEVEATLNSLDRRNRENTSS